MYDCIWDRVANYWKNMFYGAHTAKKLSFFLKISLTSVAKPRGVFMLLSDIYNDFFLRK